MKKARICNPIILTLFFTILFTSVAYATPTLSPQLVRPSFSPAYWYVAGSGLNHNSSFIAEQHRVENLSAGQTTYTNVIANNRGGWYCTYNINELSFGTVVGLDPFLPPFDFELRMNHPRTGYNTVLVNWNLRDGDTGAARIDYTWRKPGTYNWNESTGYGGSPWALFGTVSPPLGIVSPYASINPISLTSNRTLNVSSSDETTLPSIESMVKVNYDLEIPIKIWDGDKLILETTNKELMTEKDKIMEKYDIKF